uniref:Uncharacterized protein n=1 Tax=Ananas comosus var. bracteatus TaxID=296719 RepID=A0A6V7PMR0_ANACO|nr:unnamed protein product [Ananas comosus var. bracteatus]
MLRRLLPWPHHAPQTLTLTLTLTRSKSESPSPPRDSYDPPSPHPPKSPPAKVTNSLPKTLSPNQIKPSAPFHSDLPFDFRYSYSESDHSVRPIGFREPPRFSPSAPAPRPEMGRRGRAGAGAGAGGGIRDRRSSVLGEPLTEEEIEELVERYRHSDCSRQINLGLNPSP